MPIYEWIWEGQTQKGSCAWRTRDGELQDGTRWTSDIEFDIIERTKATYYATVMGEFAKTCREQGITVALKSVDVQCEIVEDAIISNCYYGSRGEHEFCNYNQLFIVKVKGTVVFESEQDLAESPIAPALIIVLAKAIALIIIALGVAYGIYDFLRNLTLNETKSTVTIRKYDENGNLIEETTEDTSKKEPATTAWISIIVLGGLVLGALVVLPSLLEKRNRKRRR